MVANSLSVPISILHLHKRFLHLFHIISCFRSFTTCFLGISSLFDDSDLYGNKFDVHHDAIRCFEISNFSQIIYNGERIIGQPWLGLQMHATVRDMIE